MDELSLMAREVSPTINCVLMWMNWWMSTLFVCCETDIEKIQESNHVKPEEVLSAISSINNLYTYYSISLHRNGIVYDNGFLEDIHKAMACRDC